MIKAKDKVGFGRSAFIRINRGYRFDALSIEARRRVFCISEMPLNAR